MDGWMDEWMDEDGWMYGCGWTGNFFWPLRGLTQEGEGTSMGTLPWPSDKNLPDQQLQ
jgi:hypothetical protein